MENKIKIRIIDFLPEFRKHDTGKRDLNGTPIHYGDTVKYRDENYFVSYRYGNMCLKQPNAIHTIGLQDYSQVEVTNICGSAPDYLIIGCDNEPFIQELLKLYL